jgi:DNA/RNA endonuclease G (NUC1)
MRKILLLFSILLSFHLSFSQKVVIDSTAFTIHHNTLTFYLDKDTASYISIQTITYNDLLNIDGVRSDKWHKEKPYGPYSKNAYVHTGYDLGHLTPSNITSFDDSLNYHSFSLFNQAPQLAAFNRGKWAQLEGSVEKLIKNKKTNATIITGVIYNNTKKEYLAKSRIKIPIAYYKILAFADGTIKAWMGSNINGLLTETDVKTIHDVAKQNKNTLSIKFLK